VVVISMAIVIEKPYAACMLVESLKYSITAMHPTQSIQLMLGMYICPFILLGNLIVILGQKLRLTASLISVKEPLINAWLAIMVAIVATIIAGNKNWCGIIS
jgi:hypothetical protein